MQHKWAIFANIESTWNFELNHVLGCTADINTERSDQKVFWNIPSTAGFAQRQTSKSLVIQ